MGHQHGTTRQDDEVAVVLGLQVHPGVGGQVMGGDVRHGPVDPLHVPSQTLAENLLGLADGLEAVELLLGAGGKLGLVEILSGLAKSQSHITKSLPRFRQTLLQVAVSNFLEDCLSRLGKISLPLAQLIPACLTRSPGGAGGRVDTQLV